MKMNHNKRLRKGACPPPEAVVASVMDKEMSAGNTGHVEHVMDCARCRSLIQDTIDTVARLRQATENSPCRDLASEVLARIPGKAWRARPHESRAGALVCAPFAWNPVRIAAAALLLIGAGMWVLRLMNTPPQPASNATAQVSAVDRGIEWLLARQTSSGGWNAQALGGNPAYAPALNGLAVLALTRADSDIPGLNAVLSRATAFLVGQQADDGRFGENFDGIMYNQGIATLALLEAYGVTRDEALREPITKGLAFIRSRQAPTGGWGYQAIPSAAPNNSITAWQIQSLVRADRLGWAGNRIALRKAVAWISGTVNGHGFFGYERPQHFPEGPKTLTMMGAYCLLATEQLGIPLDPAVKARISRGLNELAADKPNDYYGTYFYAAALSEADTALFGDVLAEARLFLIARQEDQGNDAGTWLAGGDRWGSAGGQLYSTPMALLALTPRHRGASRARPL